MAALIRRLVMHNGLSMRPSILFDPQGEVWPQEILEWELRESEHRLQRDEAFRSRVALNACEMQGVLGKWSAMERSLKPTDSDVKWFQRQFGFVPETPAQVRARLMREGCCYLHLFLDSQFLPRTDLAQLLCLLRALGPLLPRA